MNLFDLGLLSRHRCELMGISAVGIILCHAHAHGVYLPTPFSQLLSLGGLGTLMFFFLSGFGLYFSLNKRTISIGQWYKNRFLKLFIPYSIVYVPFLIISVIKGQCDVWTAILRWSTLGYWFGYGGAWFVDFLVVLYLVAPLCYELVENCKHRWIPILAIMLLMIGLANIFPKFAIPLEKGMLFFLGYWVAPYSKKSINVKWITIIGLSIGLALLCKFVPSLLVLAWFWPFFFIFMMITCALVKMKSFKWLQTVLSFMGGICFESYLFNVSLGDIIPFFKFEIFGVNISAGFYLRYLIIIVLGVFLSFVFNKFNAKLIKKVVK